MPQVELPDIADLCLGSVLLATGGGGDPHVAQLMCESAIKKFGPVSLQDMNEVDDNALVVALGEVGAPSVSLEQLPRGDEAALAMHRMQQFLGRSITHLVPFEVGGANSLIPLVAAAETGLPVIDGDGMGRALPEAQMMTFALHGIRPTPAVAIDYRGEATIFETTDPLHYERQIRNLAIAMGGMVFTAEHPMSGAQLRPALVRNSISFAIRIGKCIRQTRGTASDKLEALKPLFASSHYGDLKQLYEGKVVDVQRVTRGGFDYGQLLLEQAGDSSIALKIDIKNEYLVARMGEEVLASVPDLIMLVDTETGTPINSERLHYGQRVAVWACACPPHYRTAEGLAAAGPAAFGFDFPYKPL